MIKYEGFDGDLSLEIVPNLYGPEFKNDPVKTIEIMQGRYKSYKFPEIVDKDGYPESTDIEIVNGPNFVRL